MAGYAANVLKVKKVGVIDDRTAFGQGLADEFAKEAQKLGLTVVGREFTTDKATDFMAILTNMKAKQPEVIFYGGYAPQAAPMARQMKQLDIVRVFLKRHLMEQFYTSLFNQMDSSDNKDVSPYFFIYDKSKN